MTLILAIYWGMCNMHLLLSSLYKVLQLFGVIFLCLGLYIWTDFPVFLFHTKKIGLFFLFRETYHRDVYYPTRIWKVLAGKKASLLIPFSVMSSENTWLLPFCVHISGMFLLSFSWMFMQDCAFSVKLAMHNMFSLQVTFEKLYHCLVVLWWAQLRLTGTVKCACNKWYQ